GAEVRDPDRSTRVRERERAAADVDRPGFPAHDPNAYLGHAAEPAGGVGRANAEQMAAEPESPAVAPGARVQLPAIEGAAEAQPRRGHSGLVRRAAVDWPRVRCSVRALHAWCPVVRVY